MGSTGLTSSTDEVLNSLYWNPIGAGIFIKFGITNLRALIAGRGIDSLEESLCTGGEISASLA